MRYLYVSDRYGNVVARVREEHVHYDLRSGDQRTEKSSDDHHQKDQSKVDLDGERRRLIG